jgi:hypothetical protein
VPPCFDVYVWVRTNDMAAVLSRFIDQYVNGEDPGDPVSMRSSTVSRCTWERRHTRQPSSPSPRRVT